MDDGAPEPRRRAADSAGAGPDAPADDFFVVRRDVTSDGRFAHVVEPAAESSIVVLRWFARAFGAIVVVSMRRSGELASTRCGNLPAEFLESIQEGLWFDRDLVGDYIQSSRVMLRPEDLERYGADEPDAIQQLAVRRRHGLPLPYACPIWSEGALSGHVSLAVRRRLTTAEERVFVVYAPAVWSATARGLETRVARSLTAREVDCLRWIAQGKTAWETARILGVSEHTVVHHLRHAGHKLGAVNRRHLVAEALRLGIID
jgi:DNA-binding CsgD family transcriptional regulator